MRLRTRELPVFPVTAPIRPGVDASVQAVNGERFEFGPEGGPGHPRLRQERRHCRGRDRVNTCGFIEAAGERSEGPPGPPRGLSYEANVQLLGRRLQVLVDYLTEDDPDYAAVGRTQGQALEIDGQTWLSGAEDIIPGTMLSAEVVDVEACDLMGRVVDG